MNFLQDKIYELKMSGSRLVPNELRRADKMKMDYNGSEELTDQVAGSILPSLLRYSKKATETALGRVAEDLKVKFQMAEPEFEKAG